MSLTDDYAEKLDAKILEFEGLCNFLDDLQTKAAPLTEDERKSIKKYEDHIDDQARYLTVLISGLLEVSIKETVEDYFFSRAPDSSRYISETWPKSKNMWFDEIVLILKKIDLARGESFKTTTQVLCKNEIDLILKARNKIVHGQSYIVVSSNVRLWFQKAKYIVDQFSIYL